jgi:hypothetical protein
MERLNIKIKKSTIWAFVTLVLFRIVLDLAYYYVIHPHWGYAGFTLDLNNLKLVESYLLLFIIFILMPKSTKKLSNVLIWIMVLVSYMPMLTFFAFTDAPRAYMYAVSGFWVLVFLLLYVPMPKVALPSLKQGRVIRYAIFIGLGTVVVFLIFRYLGISFSLDLLDVYEVRSEYIAAGIPLGGYLIPWMGKIVNPIFFALFLRQRRWLLVALTIVVQLIIFSATGHKGYLFILPFVFALIWIIQRKNPLLYMGLGLFGVVLAGWLLSSLADNYLVSSLFTRRTLMIPGQLSFTYYDFFSQNDLVYLSASRLGFFASYPYQIAPPYLIGGVYFGAPTMNANTGITGDAFMNFGFFGLVLWGVLLAVILRLIDTCGRHVDLRLGVAVIAAPALSLTNSGLLTNILTHGLWLALLLLYLLPKCKENEYFLPQKEKGLTENLA